MSVNTAKLEYYIGQAGFKVPTKIKKRDGNVVKFDIHRIEHATTMLLLSVIHAKVR